MTLARHLPVEDVGRLYDEWLEGTREFPFTPLKNNNGEYKQRLHALHDLYATPDMVSMRSAMFQTKVSSFPLRLTARSAICKNRSSWM